MTSLHCSLALSYYLRIQPITCASREHAGLMRSRFKTLRRIRQIRLSWMFN